MKESTLSKAMKEIGRRGGLARARNRTPEELSAIGRNAVAAREEKRRAKRDAGVEKVAENEQ